MKTYNKREIHRILVKNGFYVDHCKGSHIIYKNSEGWHITIGSCKFNKVVFQRLIKENNLIV